MRIASASLGAVAASYAVSQGAARLSQVEIGGLETQSNDVHDDPTALAIPTTTLNNGVELPMVGLGTWQYSTEQTYDAVLLALRSGYRHIDTATIYGNQRGVGRALKTWEKETGGRRDQVFITTKIPGGLNYSAAAHALDATLEELMTDYVDMMLVHMPSGWDMKGGPEARVEGWHAMDDFYKANKTRATGVSHFCKHHLQDILATDYVKPQVNQVEFHVGMGRAGPNATDDRTFVEESGVLFQGFSPLCGPCGTSELVSGSMVSEIGKKYNKSGAQVSLRWQVQQGIPVIPKSSDKAHMLENADLFSWVLSDEDMETLTNAEVPPVTGGGGDGTSGDCGIL